MSQEHEHYVIGIVEEKIRQETNLGLRVDMYLSLLKSSLGWEPTFVKVVAWNEVAQQALRFRKPETVLVVFKQYADLEEPYRDRDIKKVKATQVSKLTTKELTLFLTDADGRFNPFGW